MSELAYFHEGKRYGVSLTYKPIRNIYYRFRDGAFFVNAPYGTSQKTITAGLDKYYGRLTRGRPPRTPPIGDGYVYLFGERHMLRAGEGGPPVTGPLSAKNRAALEDTLKGLLLEKITALVRAYEKKMGVRDPYKVRVRAMKSRFGSNSKKTHALSFQLALVHFSPRIIESVVVHELAHDRYMGHGKRFYAYVGRFLPDYRALHAKLRKGEFA